MVAGLEEVTTGDVLIGDRWSIAGAAERDIAMVFQNYALYPHMTSTTTWPTAQNSRDGTKAEIEEPGPPLPPGSLKN